MLETSTSRPRFPAAASPVREPLTAKRTVVMLALLTVIYMCSSMDRSIITLVLEPIRRELSLSDTQIGVVAGLAYSVGYTITSLPIGRLADRVNRKMLILSCLTAWSAMTAFCGLASSYVQLVLARLGVGAAEAVGSVNLSLIADLYPIQRRATALSVYTLGVPMGAMAAALLAGPVTAAYGWRSALLLAAAPGLLIGLLLMLFGKEPPRERLSSAAAAEKAPGFKETIRFVSGQRSMLHLVVGLVLIAFTLSGLGSFAVSFFVRYHGMHQTTVAAVFGPAHAGSLVVMIFSAMLADRLGRRDPRLRLWLVAGVLVVNGSLLMLAYTLAATAAFAAFIGAFLVAQVWAGPAYATFQSLAQPRMRGTSAALMYLCSNLVGAGLGPVLVGYVSDRMAVHSAGESLRWAMILVNFMNFWAAYHFFRAGRTLKQDLVRAGVDDL